MNPSARDSILNGIRAALRRGPLDPSAAAIADARLEARVAAVVPAIARGHGAALVERFVTNAEAAAATVERVGEADLGAAVARYLRAADLPTDIAVAADPRLDALEHTAPLTARRRGRPAAADVVGVSHALAGVAETGTLMLASGPDSPSTLNVLPDIHVIVVRADDIVGGLEDAWARLRVAHPDVPPRTVHLITGPSRTGDIEQTIQLGAHGPRRLHIVLLDDGAAPQAPA